MVCGSALTGAGMAELLALIDARLAGERQVAEVRLDPADGEMLAWLYRHGEVLSRSSDEADGGATRLRVALRPADLARLNRRLEDGADGGRAADPAGDGGDR